jgi:hypothetical protein
MRYEALGVGDVRKMADTQDGFGAGNWNERQKRGDKQAATCFHTSELPR